jgi:hypothetical protein
LQPPQCASLVAGSTHAPPQQTRPAEQVTPHAPQLLGSAAVLRHAPSQQAVPAGQTFPHAPQFCASERTARQMPAQQSVVAPTAQAVVQAPPTVTCARAAGTAQSTSSVSAVASRRSVRPGAFDASSCRVAMGCSTTIPAA